MPRPAPRGSRPRRRRSGRAASSPLLHGQLEVELRPRRAAALEGERARVLLDDAMADGEPEARALAGALRREERLEDARARGLGDARAGIEESRTHVALAAAHDAR